MNEAILDAMMPGPGWKAIYEQRVKGRISPFAAKEGYVEEYRLGLKRLGYEAFSKVVSAPEAVGQERVERYHLIFATRHPAGERIMLDVFERPYVLDYITFGQPPLFE
jgi:hypothetical protein